MPAVPLIGYADPLSVRPSEVVSFKVQPLHPGSSTRGTRGRSRAGVARLPDTAGNTTRQGV